MSLREILSDYWRSMQGQLFPFLEEDLGPLGERHKQFVMVLELVRVENFVRHWHGFPGRPRKDRAALARAFLAKAQFNIPQTDMLIERLGVDKALRRLERQSAMSLPEMLADLPRHCTVGTKRNAKGYKTSWTGYKLHLDVADGSIPVSCLLTSASLHDSQTAIPLATMTAARLTNLYDLMDSAYDAPEIKDHSRTQATTG